MSDDIDTILEIGKGAIDGIGLIARLFDDSGEV